MTPNETMHAHTEDYDDSPWKSQRNPVIRLLLVLGCLTTLIVTGLLCALQQCGVRLTRDWVFVGGIVSMASIPVIMHVWREEISWTGSKFDVFFRVFCLSVLTWFAELLLSALALFVSVSL